MPSDYAQVVLTQFQRYHAEFQEITARSPQRFADRDWRGAQDDANQRAESYDRHVAAALAGLGPPPDDPGAARAQWLAVRERFAQQCQDLVDADLAESFFNSVTRERVSKVGVDPELQFVTAAVRAGEHLPTLTRYYSVRDPVHCLAAILATHPVGAPYEDVQRDARRAAEMLTRDLADFPLESITLVDAVFYRNKGAYLVGRLEGPEGHRPMALAILHPDDGPPYLDAMITDRDQVSILFSYARSSFRVACPCPYQLVAFLKALLPRKPVAELYTSIGYHKHGKTELYRNFIRHLGQTQDRFIRARGERGMVMICFTLPSYEVVFKIIKDRFDYPKRTTRTRVMESYRLVSRHDRVGRMVDAQEFQHLRLDRSRFEDELLEELLRVAPDTVEVQGDQVICHHVYTERRVVPLNLYLREAEPAQALAAVVDYGQCIKDLATANIFPGDMFLKNFGVTRHGRVVFYDYDEVLLVTDCKFRSVPVPDDGDDLEGETYFYVGPNDVFPEEFRRFVGLKDELLEPFEAHHRDLFTVAWWQQRKEMQAQGEWADILPYPQNRRFSSRQPRGVA